MSWVEESIGVSLRSEGATVLWGRVGPAGLSCPEDWGRLSVPPGIGSGRNHASFLSCGGGLLPREEENRYCGQLLARRCKPRINNRPGKFPGITMNPQR